MVLKPRLRTAASAARGHLGEASITADLENEKVSQGPAISILINNLSQVILSLCHLRHLITVSFSLEDFIESANAYGVFAMHLVLCLG